MIVINFYFIDVLYFFDKFRLYVVLIDVWLFLFGIFLFLVGWLVVDVVIKGSVIIVENVKMVFMRND